MFRARTNLGGSVAVFWLQLLVGVLAQTAVVTAQQVTIHNVKAYAVTHSSVRWTFETSGANPVCYQVKYGVASGSYPYSSNSVCNSDQKISLAIGGLAPSTKFFFRMTARPKADVDTGICAADDCGSVEQTLTTLAEPAVHPQLPAPPKSWQVSHPDTSKYIVVPINASAGLPECVAAADVPAAGVHAHDTISKILNEISYGTVLEFPQDAVCRIPSAWNSGYALPRKPLDPAAKGSIDSPSHKWIVLRTAQRDPSDFPPFGARTGGPWATHLAKFVAEKPTTWGGENPGKGRAQIFGAEDGGGQHHFWFENLEFTTTGAAQSTADALDPPPYSSLFAVFPTFPNVVPPDVSYIVLDRIYFHGQGAPARYNRGVTLGGRYQAMIGCALDNLDYWRIAVTPAAAPKLSEGNTVLAVPPASYSANAKDPPIGTTEPAKIVLRASGGYAGKYQLQLGPRGRGLTVLYSKPASGTVSIACTNCEAVEQNDPAVQGNAYRYCSGTIANGQFSPPNCALAVWETSAYGYGWGTVGLELMDGGTGPYYIANNYFGAVGMGLYVDAGGNAGDGEHHISYSDNSNDDVWFVHNHLIWPQDHRFTSKTSDGYRYPVRNLLEIKRGKRWMIKGNLFQGHWSYQNDGAALLFAGAADPYPIINAVTGVVDHSVVSNVIRHGAVGIEAGGTLAEYAAPEQPGNMLIENNLLYDLAARKIYSDGDPSLFTGWLAAGFRDMTVRHNTVGLTYGNMPVLLMADVSGTLMEGLSYTDNIVYMSAGGTASGVWIADGNGEPNHLRQPRIDHTTYKTMLDSSYVRIAGSSTPNYLFAHNVFVPGEKFSEAGQDARSLSREELDDIARKLPGNNFFPLGKPDKLSGREATVGFQDAPAWNYRLLPSSPYAKGGLHPASDGTNMGVDYDRLFMDLGMVTDIAPVSVSGVVARFQYTAPSEDACRVDVNADSPHWSAASDKGGERKRALTVSGLKPDALYRYRIICYYQQVNDGAVYSDYTPDQITDGTFRTGH